MLVTAALRTCVLVLISSVSLASDFSADFAERFPLGPDPKLTPGTLCQHADERRYPERIVYCKRDVETQTKREIFRTYDRVLGFETQEMDRGQFKIDHYIPLCMGGSNDVKNLWPQHKSVYEVTDDMEHIGCEKLSQGLIKQRDVIELVRKGKNNLDEVPDIIEYLESL